MAKINNKVLEITNAIDSHALADEIAMKFQTWKNARSVWENEKKELRNYLFATDTSKTSNSALPWKNSTTMPKLTQIRDNLHANYLQALFPHDDWFTWQPASKEEADKDKSEKIVAYMSNKMRQNGFKTIVAKLLYDYIDYGNAFAEVGFVSEYHAMNGMINSTYSGPLVYRISPFDIVFDLNAETFHSAPKITRSFISVGELKKTINSNPAFSWAEEAIKMAETLRINMREFPEVDVNKHSGINIDGFGDFNTYLSSGVLEILEFEGDIFDPISGTFMANQRVIVVDRCHVVHQEEFQSWLGRSSKEHCGWRLRPDNLMAMGPLDNLVGMQYRIDHLENLKADVFDQIAHPVIVKRGYVEDFEWGPGAEVNVGEDSAIDMMRPDATALNADFQISNLMNQMEEMAGAPKQAMGFRTPGEKTAFEVSQLENAASRIFQNKIQWFEEQILEPILNQMLEQARRNLSLAETISIVDQDFGVVQFIEITRDDIASKGKLIPRGARHFARKNQLAQNLMGLANSAMYADPSVNVHISGLELARTIEELLDLDKFGLVRENVRLTEQMETQRAQTAMIEMQAKQMQAADAADDQMLEQGMQGLNFNA